MNKNLPCEDDRLRWWYLPSWLGLDAPCVVSIWTIAIAISIGQAIVWGSVAALFASVWIIYLLDRLVDVSRCTDWSHVTGRMRFGRRFRWLYLVLVAFAAVALSALATRGSLPINVIARGTIVAGGMLIYLMTFVVPLLFGRCLPGKEILVGLFFALGAFAVIGIDSRSLPLMIGLWAVVTFNCLVIAARDREADAHTDTTGASCWWLSIQRDLYVLGAVAIVAAISIAAFSHVAFGVTLAIAFGLLMALHRRAQRIPADAVRAIADFCLLTPVPWIAARLLLVASRTGS